MKTKGSFVFAVLGGLALIVFGIYSIVNPKDQESTSDHMAKMREAKKRKAEQAKKDVLETEQTEETQE